jgi:exosome complex component RRP4
MPNEVAELLIPGDDVGEPELKAGLGTYKKDGKIFASTVGVKSVRSGYVNVSPLRGRYMPRPGDSIVGVVSENGPSSWFVDINSPYTAMLHVSEAPWKVDFGETAQFLRAGEVVLAKIAGVDETKRTQLTMKEAGLRKLAGGIIVEIPHTKVPRVIGKGGSMIGLLKQDTGCRMFVGQNGRIWIEGDVDAMSDVEGAVELIGHSQSTEGLDDAVRKFLSQKKGD